MLIRSVASVLAVLVCSAHISSAAETMMMDYIRDFSGRWVCDSGRARARQLALTGFTFHSRAKKKGPDQVSGPFFFWCARMMITHRRGGAATIPCAQVVRPLPSVRRPLFRH